MKGGWLAQKKERDKEDDMDDIDANALEHIKRLLIEFKTVIKTMSWSRDESENILDKYTEKMFDLMMTLLDEWNPTEDQDDEWEIA